MLSMVSDASTSSGMVLPERAIMTKTCLSSAVPRTHNTQHTDHEKSRAGNEIAIIHKCNKSLVHRNNSL
eukprot:10685101-Alexandrium_andersonii.AAC.1